MTAIAPRPGVGSETTTDSPSVERPVAKANGAKRALIRVGSKQSFLDVSADIVEHVEPVFFGNPKAAAMKVLGGR